MVSSVLLREAASRVRSIVPSDGYVARISGDLFAVALPTHHDPRRVAAAIQAAIRARPLHAAGTTTMSIGVVTRTTEATYDEMAKRDGRDRVR